MTEYGREAGFILVGYGILGYVLLYFKAVAPKSRMTHVFSSMILSASMAVLALLFIIGFGGKALPVWNLSRDGVVTDAEVTYNRLNHTTSGKFKGTLSIR